MHTEKLRVYVNGRIVPAGSAISVFDWGFNYGYGLFETIRAYSGVPAFLEDHLERLRSSARALQIATDGLEGIEREIEKLIRLNGLEGTDSRVKIVLTKGVSMDVTSLPEKPTLIITVAPVDVERIERLKRDGINAVLLDGWGGCGRHKTLNHLKNIMGRMEALKRGGREGIFTTKRGTVLEGTASNLFVVEAGCLKTPPLKGGHILPGVTRKKILEVAEELGIHTIECRLKREELFKAEGLFLTNSVLEVVPVKSLDGKRVGSLTGRKITRNLQKAFSKLILRGR